MAETPAKTPKDELTDAIETLKRLAVAHAQGANLPRIKFFVTAIEADLDYAINPEQMIAAFKA